MKYPLWYQEKTAAGDPGALLKKQFRSGHWPYDKAQDYLTCPQGKKLHFMEEKTITSENGYHKIVRIY